MNVVATSVVVTVTFLVASTRRPHYAVRYPGWQAFPFSVLDTRHVAVQNAGHDELTNGTDPLMSRTSTFPLHDRAIGDLAGKLTAWRSEGLSYVDIARKLDTEHEVTVDPATVGRWCRSLAEESA